MFTNHQSHLWHFWFASLDGAQDLMQKLEKEHEEKQVGFWDDLVRAHQHLERIFCSRTTWVGKYRSSNKDPGTPKSEHGAHPTEWPWSFKKLKKTNLKVSTGCNFVGEIAKDFTVTSLEA